MLSGECAACTAFDGVGALEVEGALNEEFFWLLFEERFLNPAILKEVIVSLFQKCVSMVACLYCVIVAGTWGQLYISKGAFDVETQTHSIESGWFDRLIILLVAVRPRLH